MNSLCVKMSYIIIKFSKIPRKVRTIVSLRNVETVGKIISNKSHIAILNRHILHIVLGIPY